MPVGDSFMNVNLRGKANEIIQSMVQQGYANTKSEAIRLAIMSFGEKKRTEEELVRKKMDYMDQQVKEGKGRLLTAEEALGKYAKNIKSR